MQGVAVVAMPSGDCLTGFCDFGNPNLDGAGNSLRSNSSHVRGRQQAVTWLWSRLSSSQITALGCLELGGFNAQEVDRRGRIEVVGENDQVLASGGCGGERSDLT